MDEFHERILSYKEEPKTTSPIWIWFYKSEANLAQCLICKKTFQVKDSTTTSIITHLKRFHGFLSKYNAWKIYEELGALKWERIKTNKRKQSVSSCEPTNKRQKTINNCVKTTYGPEDPRQN